GRGRRAHEAERTWRRSQPKLSVGVEAVGPARLPLLLGPARAVGARVSDRRASRSPSSAGGLRLVPPALPAGRRVWRRRRPRAPVRGTRRPSPRPPAAVSGKRDVLGEPRA